MPRSLLPRADTLSSPHAHLHLHFHLLPSLPPRAELSNLHPGPLPFFAFVFAASKYVELFDTVLMIVKRPRRNVIFLHWYHHCTVLLFTWYTAAWGTTAGIFFVVVNATVHSFMYYFYFRGALGGRISWSKSLTMLQMTQMVAGIGIGLIVSYKWWVTTTKQITTLSLSSFLPFFLSRVRSLAHSHTHAYIHTRTRSLFTPRQVRAPLRRQLAANVPYEAAGDNDIVLHPDVQLIPLAFLRHVCCKVLQDERVGSSLWSRRRQQQWS